MASIKKQREPITEEEAIEILNVSIQCVHLQDMLQKLNKTTFVNNNQIVRNAKILINSLDYILKDVAAQLFNASSEQMEDAVQMRADLLTGLSTIIPEDWQMVAYAAKWATEKNSLKYAQLKALCIAYDCENIDKYEQ